MVNGRVFLRTVELKLDQNSKSSSGAARCGLCQSEVRLLVDSHIYPRWMARLLGPDGGPLIYAPTDPEERPFPIHRHGEYDKIVCADCETTFNAADAYFLEFWKQRDSGIPIGDARGVVAHEYPNVDSTLIAAFFVTCLFRAHLSSRRMWKEADLGARAEPARVFLTASDIFTPPYQVILIREKNPLSRAMIAPKAIQVGEIEGFQLTVPDFTALLMAGHAAILGDYALGQTEHPMALVRERTPPAALEALLRVDLHHGQKINRMARAFAPKGPAK